MASNRQLSDECTAHLEQALAETDPEEKDFHVRQVLQACGVDHLPEETNNE
ncbi:hypothetical protein [Natronorubrum sulfidifaciens]|uniref:Uncharacterized protein n=1 Tax=Natronorubrum sulfidifaciens JCM 14089 TaxID=1230460 RepID=L9W1Y5_9EURY|nr:hypothetical protein [Natronorubrum sulfidifaciens]ELY43460.1 hypothetical protein C495_13781 [Natronorubrum sulfidifaciens JCM 14089]